MDLNSNFKSYLIALVLLQFLTVYVKSSPVIFEHDILVEQDTKLAGNEQLDGIQWTKRAALKRDKIWDVGVIPYVFDENAGFTHGQKVLMKEAMQTWESSTCIKFIERNEREHDYFICFTRKSCGCCSFLGKQTSFKYIGQTVSIGDGCHDKGVILHELDHVIGFCHVDRIEIITQWTHFEWTIA